MNRYLFQRTDSNVKTKVRVEADTVESARSQALTALGTQKALLKLIQVTVVPSRRSRGKSPVDPAFLPDTPVLAARTEAAERDEATA